MQGILKRINRIGGVRGTMIVANDGIIIAEDIAGSEDSNTLGAVASSVVSTLCGALDRLKEGAFSRFVMTGSDGKVVLLVVREAILLTLVQKDANMGMVLVELKDSSIELKEKLGGG